jgi:hypothetical protein
VGGVLLKQDGCEGHAAAVGSMSAPDSLVIPDWVPEPVRDQARDLHADMIAAGRPEAVRNLATFLADERMKGVWKELLCHQAPYTDALSFHDGVIGDVLRFGGAKSNTSVVTRREQEAKVKEFIAKAELLESDAEKLGGHCAPTLKEAAHLYRNEAVEAACPWFYVVGKDTGARKAHLLALKLAHMFQMAYGTRLPNQIATIVTVIYGETISGDRVRKWLEAARLRALGMEIFDV